MAPTGIDRFSSSNSIVNGLNRQLALVGIAEAAILKSRQNKIFERNLDEAIKSLKHGASSKDPFLCFELEKVCIFFEKDFFATTEQDHKRLDKQLSENGATVLSAKLVFDSQKYKQHIQDVYGPDRKIIFPPAGEPCVTITRKQIQQLARPKSGITSPKVKEFYATRQANLHCALDMRIVAQCAALGISVPKQKQARGLEL